MKPDKILSCCLRVFNTVEGIVLLFLLLAVGSVQAGGDLAGKAGTKGGVVVQVGCADMTLLKGIHQNKAYLVCGLDRDPANVTKARKYLDSVGCYGRVSAEIFDGMNLPYGDRIVNMVILTTQTKVSLDEIIRVLVPNGVLLTKSECSPTPKLKKVGSFNGWEKYVKPWPKDIDHWSHYLYDASGNAVSNDQKVYRPRHMQWYAGPRRVRHHDALASLSAMTSYGGRLFYIFDEGPTTLVHRPPKWRLIARDAFNGKLLWKRDIPSWMTHLYNFRAGPKQLPRRLVSVEDGVYVTLGLSAPVVKLDAATGKTLMTFPNSAKTEELIYHNGVLLTAIGDPSILIDKADGCYGYWELAEDEKSTVHKRIAAYDAGTGKELWTFRNDNLKDLVPMSLCARGDSVFYLDSKQLHRIDLTTGKEKWASPFETKGLFIRSYAPTVVATDDVIMCLKWDRLVAYSVATGKQMWENKGAMGFGSPGDLFVIGDRVWCVPMTKGIYRGVKTDKDGIPKNGIAAPKTDFLNNAKTAVGIDIKTGKIDELLPFAHTQHHHRCYRNKATTKYLLLGHSGIQVVDPAKKTNETHRWVRGLCQYGIMPANGFIYVPPDPCRCYAPGKINGFFALSETNSWETVEHKPVTVKGPAYTLAQKASVKTEGHPWNTYRGDNARSGSFTGALPTKPAVNWKATIGTSVTTPVIAGGNVYVACRNACTVHCLDAQSGSARWKFFANGPVDSPPTIRGALCLFGCGDGSVYCLDAASGELVWRFKTSAIERRIGYEDRLESPWRISGSVLVVDETVYFAAGYSSNLDGGIMVYGLDIRTGAIKHERKLGSGHWGSDSDWGSLSDVLVSDGSTIGMRANRLGMDLGDYTAAPTRKKKDEPQKGKKKKKKTPFVPGQLVAQVGLLDSTWFHRLTWQLKKSSGNLISTLGDQTVSVLSPYRSLWSRGSKDYKKYNQVGHPHQKFTRYKPEFFCIGTTLTSQHGVTKQPDWSRDIDFQPRAMLLTDKSIYLAGWKDALVIKMKTGLPTNPANPDPRDSSLRIYSAADGKLITRQKLDAEPVFNGIAAAGKQIFLSLKNGTVVCLRAATR